MKDLNYREKEAGVRSILEREFGTRLPETGLEVAKGVIHKFDLVSASGGIVGEIKTNEPNKSPKHLGEVRQAVIDACARDCFLLLNAKAGTPIFVLTNRVIHDKFIKTEYGKVAEERGIDIRCIEI